MTTNPDTMPALLQCLVCRTNIPNPDPGVDYCGEPCRVSERQMKALTISQPFATLIARGEKFVENRTWETRYRGPLAIHAGKGTQYMTKKEMAEECFPSGQVIAIANLLACMPLESMRQVGRANKVSGTELTIGDILDHEHTEGPWCWVLSNVRAIDPVDAKGAQGIWNWTP